MGSSFALEYTRLTHREFRRWRSRFEVTVLGADGSASTDYRAVTYRRPTLITLGEERMGLSMEQRSSCDGFVRIPMSAGPDSLNIAMAGTVLLFEARSQRHPVKRPDSTELRGIAQQSTPIFESNFSGVREPTLGDSG